MWRLGFILKTKYQKIKMFPLFFKKWIFIFIGFLYNTIKVKKKKKDLILDRYILFDDVRLYMLPHD